MDIAPDFEVGNHTALKTGYTERNSSALGIVRNNLSPINKNWNGLPIIFIFLGFRTLML
jgi:hypothetical protein